MWSDAFTGAIIGSVSMGIVTWITNLLLFEKQKRLEMEKLHEQKQDEVLRHLIIAGANIESSLRKLTYVATDACKASLRYYGYKIYWFYARQTAYGPLVLQGQSHADINSNIEKFGNKLYDAMKYYEYEIADLVKYMSEFSAWIGNDGMLTTYMNQIETFNVNYYNLIEHLSPDEVKKFNESNDDIASDLIQNNFVNKILNELVIKIHNELDSRIDDKSPFADWKEVVRKQPKVNF